MRALERELINELLTTSFFGMHKYYNEQHNVKHMYIQCFVLFSYTEQVASPFNDGRITHWDVNLGPKVISQGLKLRQ